MILVVISLYYYFLISSFPILRMVITLYIYPVHEWMKGWMKNYHSSIWRLGFFLFCSTPSLTQNPKKPSSWIHHWSTLTKKNKQHTDHFITISKILSKSLKWKQKTHQKQTNFILIKKLDYHTTITRKWQNKGIRTNPESISIECDKRMTRLET